MSEPIKWSDANATYIYVSTAPQTTGPAHVRGKSMESDSIDRIINLMLVHFQEPAGAQLCRSRGGKRSRPQRCSCAASTAAGPSYGPRSRNLIFAKLSPTSSTVRAWKRSRSDIINKQPRSSASLSLMWFRISRRSNTVIIGSAIRRQATVCHSFSSCILRLKISGSDMLSAPPIGSK